MPNENRDDYHVELLKSVRNLKKIIDELVDKNHERMAVLEITHMRNCVEQMIKKYLLDPNRDGNVVSKFVRNSNAEECSVKSRVKCAMKELIDISSSFRAQIDVLECNTTQTGNGNADRDRDTIIVVDNNGKHHEKCEKQLKLCEEYIIELECRLRELLNFVLKDQRTDHKQLVKEIRLQSSILKLKRNESSYKNKINRLSQELNRARRRLEDSQNHTDELVLKIQLLKRVAEKNATSSANLADSLSSVAVDLSLARCDRRPATTRDDNDRRGDNASASGEMNDDASSSSAAASCRPEDVSQTFLRPTSHSTPNWRQTRAQGEDVCNGHPDDRPSTRRDGSTDGPRSMETFVCKVCRNENAETDKVALPSSLNEKIDIAAELCSDVAREIICICRNCDPEESFANTKRF